MLKLIEYTFSAVNECSPNPYVGPFPRIRISFPLLSIWIDEFISTPKIITFWSSPLSGNENLDVLSNAIPYPEYLYLLTSAFLVKVTAPNKQSSTVRLLSLSPLILATPVLSYAM